MCTNIACLQAAAQRKRDFIMGVFADPIYLGQFPDSVRARVPYLPEITPDLVCAPCVLETCCQHFVNDSESCRSSYSCTWGTNTLPDGSKYCKIVQNTILPFP